MLALSAPASALAGPKDAEARKMLKQALEEDYLETRFDDAEHKLRGAIQLCANSGGCDPAVRAELHAALGAVLAGGKKELDDARDEFVEGLKIDPKVQPDPGMLSTEVSFAYEQARKKLGLGEGKVKPGEGPRKPKPRDPEPPKVDPRADDTKDKDAKDADAGPAPESRKNWLTLTFAPDLSIVSGTNVCTAESRKNNHYVCVRDDANRTGYVGTPTLDNGDNINTGIGLATLRLMLGYDRVLVENLTVGARLGFAFNGATDGGASFIPVHAEARFGYWPGKNPFAGSGVRPYLMVSGGFAQVDTKVNVEVLEDGNKCGAQNPSDGKSPCTVPSSDGVIEKRIQTLAAYRQAGLGFAALSFGVQFAPTARVALFLAVRGNITFPVVTGVFSPEGGISLGF